MKSNIKLMHVTADPNSLFFLEGHATFLKQYGFETHAVSSPGDALEKFGKQESVRVHTVKVSRRISPIRDIISIVGLWRKFRQEKPALVSAHMSKAGLLGTIAARLARVPAVVYHNHGMAYFSSRGVIRALLRLSEIVACRLAHRVLTVSASVRNRAIESHICAPEKLLTPGNGSINGIDAFLKFNPERIDPRKRAELRQKLNIPDDATVIGFIGRITAIKGINELISAWQWIRNQHPSAHLLLAGKFDNREPVSESCLHLMQNDSRVHLPGFVSDTPAYFSAIDVFVLPSYHEGFPVSLLEASAMMLPIVATRIPGNVDAVLDGVSGTLVMPQDIEGLQNAIHRYLLSPELRRQHGIAGRRRALEQFKPEAIRKALANEYLELLRKRGVICENLTTNAIKPVLLTVPIKNSQINA